MTGILIVSHCILNTASKVMRFKRTSADAEEALRRRFLAQALAAGVQFVQLPCPEFTLYGANRWAHSRSQFDNPFFRAHCREQLSPVIDQLREYRAHPDRFRVLGVVGIDGSPSCGVDVTHEADWYGTFSGRSDLSDVLASSHRVPRRGVMIDVLSDMLAEAGMGEIPIVGLNASDPEKCLSLLPSDAQ